MKNSNTLSLTSEFTRLFLLEAIRFDVRDFRANSRGMHLVISARGPAVVEIYYMLIEGNKVVYITRELSVPISGSIAIPIVKDYT